jgi:hypothetical protein
MLALCLAFPFHDCLIWLLTEILFVGVVDVMDFSIEMEKPWLCPCLCRCLVHLIPRRQKDSVALYRV